MAETQPKLHPALLRLSAMISQYFMRTMVSNDDESTRHDFTLRAMLAIELLAALMTLVLISDNCES